MDLKEHAPVGSKTTMRIGGTARYFVELVTEQDITDVKAFAAKEGLPLIMLGGGSNTIFDDNEIQAVVARVKHDTITIEGNTVTVGAGAYLASLLVKLAEDNLDLSPLTGIPGNVGGAVVGNAGEGKTVIGKDGERRGGIWLDTFVQTVRVHMNGEWKTLSKEECGFGYRESMFKHLDASALPIVWEVVLEVPSAPKEEILAEIERLLKKRIETQPHVKTAGSVFKSLKDGTMAWKVIDGAGLRGYQVGDIQVAEKHANFLLNTGKATFKDAKQIIEDLREKTGTPLEVEMRFIQEDGTVAF